MNRQELVDVLEGRLSIQCYADETTEVLREALVVNVLDGSLDISELPDV